MIGKEDIFLIGGQLLNEGDISVQRQLVQGLEDEVPRKNYLDLGSFEMKGKTWWYFGFRYKGGQDAIVCSNRRIFVDNIVTLPTGKKAGENPIRELFDYDGYIGDIAPLISNRAIKRFFADDFSIEKRNVFDSIVGKLNYFMDFGENASMAYVQACWIIATHCYPVFHWFPHVLFHAPSESGKSKNALTMLSMSFRGFDIGASAGVSPPQIFRTLESNRGTIWIDEYEKDEKSETQRLVNQLLNASAGRDGYVVRVEQTNKKWRAWKFPIFCPKIVCNISGLNPTSLSRFITFQLLKTADAEKSKRNPMRVREKEGLYAVRDDISLLILQDFGHIMNIYETLDLPLANRDADNWLPIVSVARYIGPDVENMVMKYISTYREIRLEGNDMARDFFAILAATITEQRHYTPKEIGEWHDVRELLSHLKSPPHWVGRVLKSYQFRPTFVSGTRKYLLSPESIANIQSRYFGTEQTPPNDTNATKHNQTTLMPPSQPNNKDNTGKKDTSMGKSGDGVALGGIGVVPTEAGGVSDKQHNPIKSEDALMVLSILAKQKGPIDIMDFLARFEPTHHHQLEEMICLWRRNGAILEPQPGRIMPLE